MKVELAHNESTGVTIPSDFEVIRVEEHYIECVRPDGLRVFFDSGNDEVSRTLNRIRSLGTPEEVVKAVGIVRGMQIALNFAKKYCSELVPQLTDDIHMAMRRLKAIE